MATLMEKLMKIAYRAVVLVPLEVVTTVYLSVPAWAKLSGSWGFVRDTKRAEQDPNAPRDEQGKILLPYRGYDEGCLQITGEHLAVLGLRPDAQVLVHGARNGPGNNLGYIAYDATRTPPLQQPRGEGAEAGRVYFCLVHPQAGAPLRLEPLTFGGGKPSQADVVWAVSGIKLVWDGEVCKLADVVSHDYDLRHLWRIPGEGGQRKQSTPELIELTDRWVELRDEAPAVQAEQVMALAAPRGYPREEHCLRSAVGITEDGHTLILAVAHGTPEAVGELLLRAGAWRAIDLEQGGSCAILKGSVKELRTLIGSPHWRPRAMTLLVYELSDARVEEDCRLIG